MSTDLPSLRKRCEARLRALDLRHPFDLPSLRSCLSTQRSRPILLLPVTGRMGACGVWVSDVAADYVFYQKDTSPLHQLHIILHELSHIICDHRPIPLGDACIGATLFPDLRPELIRQFLRRDAYSTAEEREAEVLATLLLARMSRDSAEVGAPSELHSRGLLDRLVNSLEPEPERRR